MKRALVVLAAVVGFAAAANAATLSVFTTNTSGDPQNVFSPGETILLRVTGDAQAGATSFIFGALIWNDAITTTISVSQSPMYSNQGSLFTTDGYSEVFSQYNDTGFPEAPSSQFLTSTVTLIADSQGTSNVRWDTNPCCGYGARVLRHQHPLPHQLPPESGAHLHGRSRPGAGVCRADRPRPARAGARRPTPRVRPASPSIVVISGDARACARSNVSRAARPPARYRFNVVVVLSFSISAWLRARGRGRKRRAFGVEPVRASAGLFLPARSRPSPPAISGAR